MNNFIYSYTVNNFIYSYTVNNFIYSYTVNNFTYSYIVNNFIYSYTVNNFIYSYTDANQRMSSTSRVYCKTIPVFLHNRPETFIRHCMKRIELSKDVQYVCLCNVICFNYTFIWSKTLINGPFLKCQIIIYKSTWSILIQ